MKATSRCDGDEAHAENNLCGYALSHDGRRAAKTSYLAWANVCVWASENERVWASGSGSAPFHARHHQLFVSVGVPASSGTTKEELVAVRENLTGMLRSLDVPALDDALAEIDAGAQHPSTEWRRNYSLMLGLERVLSEDEPRLADGTMLNPHQVDALSGTLTALLAEVLGVGGAAEDVVGGGGGTAHVQRPRGPAVGADQHLRGPRRLMAST